MNRTILLLAALVATLVGLGLLIFPHPFFASNGLRLGASPSLLSEIRAPGALLVALGVVLIRGVLFEALQGPAALLGSIAYLSYAAARLVSILLDGFPHPNLLYAGAGELILGLACTWVYFRKVRL